MKTYIVKLYSKLLKVANAPPERKWHLENIELPPGYQKCQNGWCTGIYPEDENRCPYCSTRSGGKFAPFEKRRLAIATLIIFIALIAVIGIGFLVLSSAMNPSTQIVQVIDETQPLETRQTIQSPGVTAIVFTNTPLSASWTINPLATATNSLIPSQTFTGTPANTITPTISPTATQTATITPTFVATDSLIPSQTFTGTPANTLTPTISPTATQTATVTPTPVASNSPIPSQTLTEMPTWTATGVNLAPVTFGELIHDADDGFVAVYDPNVLLADFALEVSLGNPYSSDRGNWDYGIIFRSTADTQFRLVLFSNGEWRLLLREGDSTQTIQTGQLSTFDTSENGSNYLGINAEGESGALYVNNRFVAALLLSENTSAGELNIGTGFYTGDEITGEVTWFNNLFIQSKDPLPTSTPTMTHTFTPFEHTATLEAVDCFVRTGEQVSVTVGPARVVRGSLPENIDIRVRGYAEDADGNIWWSVLPYNFSPGEEDRYWIQMPNQSDIDISGNCNVLPLLSPPPTILAVTSENNISIGVPVRGTLAQMGTQTYYFRATAGQTVTITMISNVTGAPDAFLILYGPNGVEVARDDDSAGSRNSRIVFRINVSGRYRIVATSWQRETNQVANSAGPYTLTVTLR